MQIKQLLKDENLVGKSITLYGWIRTVRNQKSFAFIELNDGSTLSNFQVIFDGSHPDYLSLMPNLTTGASLKVEGTLNSSPGKNQALELQAEKMTVLGKSDPEKYPLQKKRHSFEFLRTIAHLRPRTNTQGAVIRVRNALSFATHKFFQENGFFYVQTPILTSSDCEGAGEMFRISLEKAEKKEELKEFFGKKTYLTVSGQLEAETLASALSKVYTFGPTFRAENSNTSRHLAEFWMIEPEMAFCDLKGDMKYAENYLRYCIRYVLDHCKEDMEFFDRFIEKGLLERLEKAASSSFDHIPYSEAIEILQKAPKKFEFPVKWGLDLQSEHERYLTEEYAKKPVILTDYPKEIKSFYMRENEDGKTVAAMDVLAPKIGEIIGGSQREERLEILEQKISSMGLNREDYWWYLELREFGTVPHAGFGLGFERLVLFITGMENIRDVIPFPRFPGHVEF